VNSEKPKNILDSLPRADISTEVGKMIPLFRDKNWKIKKEGLDKLEACFTANSNRIKIS